jgi:plasmid maintenance system killer protein
MILSFSDAETEDLFVEERSRRFADISRVALRKLIQMNRAAELRDLAIPPGNRLKALSGRLAGFTPSVSTASGVSCSGGPISARSESQSSTTIDDG